MAQAARKRNVKFGQIPDKLYFKIGEVAEIVGVKPYVLRYWETEFPDVAPGKSKTQQRLYRRKDVETILQIRHLLYEEKFTIAGARNRLKELARRGKSELQEKQITMQLPAAETSQFLSEIKTKLLQLSDILQKA